MFKMMEIFVMPPFTFRVGLMCWTFYTTDFLPQLLLQTTSSSSSRWWDYTKINIIKLIFDPETGFNNSIVNAVIERVVCDDGFDDLIITSAVEIAGDSELGWRDICICCCSQGFSRIKKQKYESFALYYQRSTPLLLEKMTT